MRCLMFRVEYSERLCRPLWRNPKRGYEMGTIRHQISPAGQNPDMSSRDISDTDLMITLLFSTGIPEQTSELGVGSVSAHGSRHGHREHPALRWIQPAEHQLGCKMMKRKHNKTRNVC